MIQHTFSFRRIVTSSTTPARVITRKNSIFRPLIKKKKFHPVKTSTTTKFNLKNSSQTQHVSNVCNEKATISTNYTVHRAPSSHVEQTLQRSCNNCNNSSRQRKTQAEIATSEHGGNREEISFVPAAWPREPLLATSTRNYLANAIHAYTHTVCMVDTRHGRKSVTFCRVGRRTLTFPNGNTGGRMEKL